MISRDEIKETIKQKNLSRYAASVLFPEVNAWTLREIHNEATAELAESILSRTEYDDVGSEPTYEIKKTGVAYLEAGCLRPITFNITSAESVPTIFSDAVEQILIISDIHAPFQDDHALDVILQIGRALPLDRVIINGDLFDVASLSKYVASLGVPQKWALERKTAAPVPARIRQAFPTLPIDFIPGNHDLRVHRWIDAYAIPLQGAFSLNQMLGIEDLDFNLIESGRILLANNQLLVKHGNRVMKNAGASVQSEVQENGMSVIMGHVHRLARIGVTKTVQSVSNSMPWIGVELGCLCDLNPHYSNPEETANWQQGAAVVSVFADGTFDIELIPIYNGQAHFRGRLFSSAFEVE